MAATVSMTSPGKLQSMQLPFDANGVCIVSNHLVSQCFGFQPGTVMLQQVSVDSDVDSLTYVLKRNSDGFYVIDREFGSRVIVTGIPEIISSPACPIVVDSPKCMESNVTEMSMFDYLLNNGGNSKLKTWALEVGTSVRVNHLPDCYDGTVVYELPCEKKCSKPMSGMEQNMDPHVWSDPSHTVVPSFPGCVKLAHCCGHLQCRNTSCECVLGTGEPNEVQWRGTLKHKPSIGELCGSNGSLNCIFCREQPECVSQCACKIYYCFPDNTSFTRLAFHIGNHNHPVRVAESRESVYVAKALLNTSSTTKGTREAQHDLATDFVNGNIISEEEISTFQTLDSAGVDKFLQKLEPLNNQRRLRRWIHKAKAQNKIGGDEFSQILYLKQHSRYQYFHGSVFPYQLHDDENERCYIFKMSTTGPGSGVDLVNRMRPGGDLEHSWVHFDHVKRIPTWTTLGCHVYDPRIRSLQTIALCDMKTEDYIAQRLFWEKLNKVMISKGFPEAEFRKFMADEAQANWTAVRDVYNNGQAIVGGERSCQFHFEQCLQRHTNKYIYEAFRYEHLDLCRKWRNAETIEIAEDIYHRIIDWWPGKADDVDIKSLASWLSWWHQRVSRWGNYMLAGMDIASAIHVPHTNLSESRHGSWLAARGYRKTMSLYDACVFDMTEALLQSSRYKAWLEGRHLGTGPNVSNLLGRLERSVGSKISPMQGVSAVNEQVSRSGMPEYNPGSGGNNRTVLRKTPTIGNSEAGSHRPDKVSCTMSRSRMADSARRTIDFDHPQLRVIEVDIHQASWALRRTIAGSDVKCMGRVSKTGRKCQTRINVGNKSTVAPSFYGIRKHRNGEQEQMMWFCSTNVQHTWYPDYSIVCVPNRPSSWPVAIGVNIKDDELQVLMSSGFEVRGLSSTCGQYSTETSSNVPSDSSTIRVRNGRHVNKRARLSNDEDVNLERSFDMEAEVISKHTISRGKHVIYELRRDTNTYKIEVSTNPKCNCPEFLKHETKGRFLLCKHMCYVYNKVLGHNPKHNKEVIQAVLTDATLAMLLGDD